ncbi:MAG: asparagine synthase (glutamine-hydrolyzing) [Chitinophagaceae bacterium]
MCGICGYIDLAGKKPERSDQIVQKMADKLFHRGPDGMSTKIIGPVTLGFTRLSIIDLSGGMQPLSNEDGSVTVICNGEIFNYVELREDLKRKGHEFRTNCDIEVLPHLYEEYGINFLNMLNGQFSFALYDTTQELVFLARDHFGILPLHYTICDNTVVFGSEVKSILEYPGIDRKPDLVALDQVFTFPGLISPRTMFENIHSLENGHYLRVDVKSGLCRKIQFWDLIYPEINTIDYAETEEYYTEKLNEMLDHSIMLRLRSDVPVGCYLSGGLDSSLIACKLNQLTPGHQRYTFSIDFADRATSEGQYQQLVSAHIGSVHSRKLFLEDDVIDLLAKTIYHCECPVKESYNTASYRLSETVRDNGIKVILTGEGADELFGGYVGYKFDRLRSMLPPSDSPGAAAEKLLRKRIWGNEDFFYEKDYLDFSNTKKNIYSADLNSNFDNIDCLNSFIVDASRMKNRDVLHMRSYADYKLRMADHLLSDHGDRMAMANSVEARYPFLDIELAEFITTIPPGFKLKDLQEKHILRSVARDIVPHQVLNREKFGFVAPSSSSLVRRRYEYVNDMLSYDRIKRQNYFDADRIESLKAEYSQEDFRLNIPFDNDLLITVLTFGVFLEQFDMA